MVSIKRVEENFLKGLIDQYYPRIHFPQQEKLFKSGNLGMDA